MSVEVALPVARHLASWPGHGLVQGVVLGRGERGALENPLGPVVVVPVLRRFEAPDDPVAGRPGMGGRVLAGRRIAATDVTAGGTAPEMEPPAFGGEALDAALTARRHGRIDQGAGHQRDATWPCPTPRERLGPLADGECSRPGGPEAGSGDGLPASPPGPRAADPRRPLGDQPRGRRAVAGFSGGGSRTGSGPPPRGRAP